MIRTARELRRELSSINLDGKNENQKGNHAILVEWIKPFGEEAIISVRNAKDIAKRIKQIKKTVIRMSDEVKSKVQAIADKMDDNIANLYFRWLDEREYEDFDAYSNLLQETFEANIKDLEIQNAVFHKCGKRPFGLTFDYEGFRVTLYATTKCYGWKSKQL